MKTGWWCTGCEAIHNRWGREANRITETKWGRGRRRKTGVWQTKGKAGETWNNRQINKGNRKTGRLQRGIKGCHRGETVSK